MAVQSYQWNTSWQHNSVAAFQNWGQQLSTAMQSIGLVKTAGSYVGPGLAERILRP